MAPCYDSDPESRILELDHVPLATRRRLLLSSKRVHAKNDVVSSAATTSDVHDGDKDGEYFGKQELSGIDSVVLGRFFMDQSTSQGEERHLNGYNEVILEATTSKISKSAEPVSQVIGISENQEGDDSTGGDSISPKQIVTTFEQAVGAGQPEKVECCAPASMLSPKPASANIACNVKIECPDGNSSQLLQSNGRSRCDIATIPSNPSDIAHDYLDHIVLRGRQKMLLESRLLPKLKNPVSQEPSYGPPGDLSLYGGKRIKTEAPSANGKILVDTNQYSQTLCNSDGSYLKNSGICSSTDVKPSGIAEGSLSEAGHYSAKATKSRSGVQNSSEHSFPVYNNDISSSMLQGLVKVKTEALDDDIIHKNSYVSRYANLEKVKSEVEIHNELEEDEIDHMRLVDRMKLEPPDKYFLASGCLKTPLLSEPGSSQITFDNVKPYNVHRPRKRKKTATNSIKTALEEDAPGLLQVLIDQGISTNEIKLYSDTDSDDVLDESLCEDSFSDLEAVISKICFQRHSFIKFPPVRGVKAQKSSYCLACLFSLVEQARYLQFRKWPVEWGWCRDLQSFIFVFERHKRIVMERPEYGYATYFFELVDTSPIGWQIKRLVTAMKLTSCGRVTLIENKPLLVGDDLSEGEAQVLMEYGWLPNTGLGTMLNYRDRVVHDRKHEKDSSEWRSKIGKLLADGYNDGVIVSTTTADKSHSEFGDLDNPSVKLELC